MAIELPRQMARVARIAADIAAQPDCGPAAEVMLEWIDMGAAAIAEQDPGRMMRAHRALEGCNL
ncbi:hypothetical protein CA223_05345 [Sphingomonas koreensis]|uniref:Uncharacterized protein n=1 Tax=Sphingomonas koreensis TaxID=93064 RepID=A0A1L6JBM0_9SPHN|nr:hypothetical protein [Sphingomonas koreensis]APR53341.1 hypothetical protein BRX40_13700 [Sphingomonas koreensis]RSU24539.1 hypothetical protein CA224_02135 [Sphingomonas koreensis]RSU25184.1 hypothetical protein CA222_13730 [Sphingomonas koreensis]RSU30141.1 hypothetical protein CA225_05620 [Sphingomonas koreensis]RSU37422.1 hypothetical protein BRX39_05905 [Sphingomonas koreensis]